MGKLRTRSRVVLSFGAFGLLFSCGLVESTPAEPSPPPTPSSVTTPGCGTLNANDCDRGLTCFGPSACGSVWKCQKEMPCSAAAPRLACGCDGRVVSVAAGCAGRHAYGLAEVFGSDGRLDVGAPCDPTPTAPYSVAVEVVGTGLEAYDGGRLWMRKSASDRAKDPQTGFPTEGLPVREGKVSYSSSPSPRAANEAHYSELLLDKNGNGRCDPGEDWAWATTPSDVDALRFVVQFVVTPSSLASFKEAQRSYCDRWR